MDPSSEVEKKKEERAKEKKKPEEKVKEAEPLETGEMGKKMER